MIIAGGTYVERCVAPASEQLMGSGGRATLALPPSTKPVLHTFHPDPEDVRANFGAGSVVHPIDGVIGFDYLHPLARPRISPIPLPSGGTVDVNGATVLRFGCLEGDFRVDADVAVYDPQNGGRSDRFWANGSRARRLAIVLNAAEASGMAGGAPPEAGAAILAQEQAEAVVVKSGPAGALVLWREGCAVVPAYRTRSVFKIGSGDVFTAMFAFHWALGGSEPAEAADLASRQAAAYVEHPALPCPPPTRDARPAVAPRSFSAALVVDGDDLAAAWLTDQAREALIAVGAHRVDVDDPVPRGGSPPDVLLAIARDAKGRALREAAVARRAGVPVTVLADQADVTAAAAALGIVSANELAGAVYGVAWSVR